jgi:hypothetical protein
MMSRLFSNVELIDAYRKAARDYDASKAGTGNRVNAYIDYLVAERVLINRLETAGGATVGGRSR